MDWDVSCLCCICRPSPASTVYVIDLSCVIVLYNANKLLLLLLLLFFLTPVLNSQGRKILLCKDKIRKLAGIVFTPPPPSQNYQEVE